VVRVRQHREEAQVQDVLHRRGLEVLEDLGPGLAARLVVEEQLQGSIVIELPGPQEAQEEGIVQPRPQIGLFLRCVYKVSVQLPCKFIKHQAFFLV